MPLARNRAGSPPPPARCLPAFQPGGHLCLCHRDRRSPASPRRCAPPGACPGAGPQTTGPGHALRQLLRDRAAVLGRHQPARLRVIHTPGGGSPGPPTRGRPPRPRHPPRLAVQVHQLLGVPADQPQQAPGHGDIRIPAHGNPMDLGEGSCRCGQGTTRRAGSRSLCPRGHQPPQQIQHLLGATVEAASAFDVKDPQGAALMTWRAASRTSSTGSAPYR